MPTAGAHHCRPFGRSSVPSRRPSLTTHSKSATASPTTTPVSAASRTTRYQRWRIRRKSSGVGSRRRSWRGSKKLKPEPPYSAVLFGRLGGAGSGARDRLSRDKNATSRRKDRTDGCARRHQGGGTGRARIRAELWRDPRRLGRGGREGRAADR